MNKKRKNKKVEKKKKKKRKSLKKKKKTVDYCCNPRCFVCGGTLNPPTRFSIFVNNIYIKKTAR